MVRIYVLVRIFGPVLWALICLGLLNRGVRQKAMVPTEGTNLVDVPIHFANTTSDF